MKIISFGACKGGAGKTMTVFHLAGCLAEKHRVLVLDADFQSNFSRRIGLDTSNFNVYSMCNIFEEDANPEDCIIHAPIKDLPNLDIIGACIKMILTREKISIQSGRELILKNYIDDHKDCFEQYDYILIDTNPGYGILDQNAYAAADSIVMISDISTDGILGCEIFDFLWSSTRKNLRMDDNIKALILNNYDARLGDSQEAFELLNQNENLDGLTLKNYIYNAIAMPRGCDAHLPINIYEPGHKNVTQLKNIIKELKRKEVL